MKRVTEPELMTGFEQVQAYKEADFSKSDDEMVSQLSNFLKESGALITSNTMIVDLGCGPGNITEKIACIWSNAKVLGVDDSPEMLRVARERQKSLEQISSLAGLSYHKINIASISNGQSSLVNCADVVVSNSLIHHIHEPFVFFDALAKISKKGAIHFGSNLAMTFMPVKLFTFSEELG